MKDAVAQIQALPEQEDRKIEEMRQAARGGTQSVRRRSGYRRGRGAGDL